MKLLLKGYTLLICLVIMSIISLFVGVSQLSITDIFHLTKEQLNILLSSRIPRTVSILISGSTLALAGLIMQQMMQNKFVSPTTAGTMEWAKLGILISLVCFPQGHILLKLAFAVLCSLFGTFLFVKLIEMIRVKEVIFVPLLGIMLGGIVSSFTTFIALRTNAVQSIGNWLNGNFAIITSGRYEILYLSIPLLIITYIFANHFTIAGMGKDFSHNLGVNYEQIVRIDHLKNALPHTMMLGACFVLFSDIIGRLIVYPFEINIGLTIGVFGTVIFLVLLMKGRKNYANDFE